MEKSNPPYGGISLYMFENHIRLKPWEEATGQLREVKLIDGICLTKIGPVDVILPEEIGENIKGFIGQRIGVLRTDNGYRFRVISGTFNSSA
jgi:hypothetical protein